MDEKQLLMIPGPTPVPPAVLRACARPMMNHRGPEFKRILLETHARLKQIFQCRNDVITLTASGTGGLEAAIVNILSPGDAVLSVSIGSFGDRFAQIAAAFGATVEKMDFPWGQAANPDRVAERLKKDTKREIKAVLVTQNETSTGVANDVQTLAKIVKEHGALLMVDAISSLIAMDCPTDAWGLDVVIAGSQKAFMIPPGLTFVALSDRAWKAYEQAKMPRFYWDFGKVRDTFASGETPWTPAVPQFCALDVSLDLILTEGLEHCFKRHTAYGKAVRAAAEACGLKLFADPKHGSPSVTAIWSPEGVHPKDLRKFMQDRYDIVTAGGQGKMKESIFRIGHLGYVSPTEILATTAAVGQGLKELGFQVDPAAGVRAAQTVLEEAKL